MMIHGVGAKIAKMLYDDGYRSIQDLKDKIPSYFNRGQCLGLQYYDELKLRMTRYQCRVIVEIIFHRIKMLTCLEKTTINTANTASCGNTTDLSKAFKISDWKNSTVEAVVCGSFRRGKLTCGDIDILIVPKIGYLPHEDLLTQIIHELTIKDGLITDTLSGTESHKSWMGIIKYEGVHRRLDIKIYPSNEAAFALLYFTGSGNFNRSMRLFARKLGYSLTDRELRRVIRQKQNVKLNMGTPVKCESEQDIFEALGLEYRYPFMREVDLKVVNTKGSPNVNR